MSRTIFEHEPPEGADRPPPIALDGFAYGVDALDAILVFHLGDAHLYASWVREDAGLHPEELTPILRESFRSSEHAMRKLARGAHPGWPGAGAGGPAWAREGLRGSAPGRAPSPLVTLETPTRLAVMRRVRSYVVAALFDASLPLGMARLVAGRLAESLEPELPLALDRVSMVSDLPAAVPAHPFAVQPPSQDEVTPGAGAVAPGMPTLSFPGPPQHEVTRPPPSRTELDRARHILAYLDANAPEPHVARLRLALRAGLTPVALEHPEALGADAMALIETAVEDMLGLDRSELRSLL